MADLGSNPNDLLPPSTLKIDDEFEIARTFLEALAPGETVFDFRVLDDDKPRRAPSLTKKYRGALAPYWPELQRLNRLGAGIFVSVNETDGKGVSAHNIKRLRAVWCEDDTGATMPFGFPLPPSMTVRTSEGKFHYYWFADDLSLEQFQGVMRCMVEVHGSDKNAKDAARVLRLPGSFHNKGDPQLVEIISDTGARYTGAQLAAAFPAPKHKELGSSTPVFPSRPWDERGADLQSALQAIPSDDRSDWITVGMALKSEYGDAGRELWDMWSQSSPKFNASDQAAKWRGFKASGGVKGNSIFHLAKQNGWKCQRDYGTDEHLASGTLSAAKLEAKYAAKMLGETLAKKPEKKDRYELHPFETMEADLSSRYLIRDVIPSTGLTIVWGPPKQGKSFWLFDLCMHIALGRKYRGRRTKRGIVIYGCFEGVHGFKARKVAFERERMAGHKGKVPFYLLPIAPDLIRERQDLIEAISDALGDDMPSVIVLDTLARSLIGSESDDEDMGKYIAAIDDLKRAFNCSVIVVHHCGHDSTRLRGHSSLLGALDTEISVSMDDSGTVKATVELMKDGRSGSVFYSTLDEVSLGHDEDGEAITSCVITEAKKPEGDAILSGGGRPSAGVGIALAALTKQLLQHGEAKLIEGETRKVCTVEAWRGQAYSDGISARSDNAKRMAFNRAFESLVADKKVRVSEPYCWLENGAADMGTMAENLLKKGGK